MSAKELLDAAQKGELAVVERVLAALPELLNADLLVRLLPAAATPRSAASCRRRCSDRVVTPSQNGTTAVMMAGWNGHSDVVRFLCVLLLLRSRILAADARATGWREAPTPR